MWVSNVSMALFTVHVICIRNGCLDEILEGAVQTFEDKNHSCIVEHIYYGDTATSLVLFLMIQL